MYSTLSTSYPAPQTPRGTQTDASTKYWGNGEIKGVIARHLTLSERGFCELGTKPTREGFGEYEPKV